MRIAYITHDSLPAPSTSSEQLVNNVAVLVGQGVEIDLFAPPVPDSNATMEQRHRDLAEFYGLREDVFSRGLALREPALPDWARGHLRKALHAMRAMRECVPARYDAVYVREMFPLVAATRGRLPVVFETYRTDINTRGFWRPWRRLCYNARLQAVITHSKLSRDSFIEAGVDPEHVQVAHNGYSPEVMTPALSREDARIALGLDPGGSYVVYTGHVNENKGIEVIVGAALRLPAVRFLVVGGVPGSHGERWAKDYVARAGCRNVELVPRVPPAQVPAYLYAADCLIIPPSRGPLPSGAHRAADQDVPAPRCRAASCGW